MLDVFILIASHAAVLALGFAVGIYVLPILTSPKGPDVAALLSLPYCGPTRVHNSLNARLSKNAVAATIFEFRNVRNQAYELA
jgi:hypothetical protein